MPSLLIIAATTWRWALWLLFLASWTVALLVTVPDPNDFGIGDFMLTRKVIVAKTVHVSAYALLAGLTGWLRAPVRWRWLLMFFVMAHGTVTELLQKLFTELNLGSRTGCLEDVGFDNLGIAVGMLLTWRWWTAADQATARNDESHQPG